ncbi:MAG: hypothetical protein ACK4V6_19155 [Microthrixaceae bacterium]
MGGSLDLPFGLATSVGSLPAADAEGAVRLALSAQPAFPTVPTWGGVDSSLLAQAMEGLEGVSVEPPGLLRVDATLAAELDDDVQRAAAVGERVDGASFEQLHRFLATIDGVPSVGVRVGVLGPVTLALALRAAGVAEVPATTLAASLVRRRARALLGAVRAVLGEGVVFVCASEPGLIGAMHPTFPLTPTQVADLLDPFVHGLDEHPRAGDLLIGVHVPGRTDWETIVSTGVSVISTPIERGLVGAAGTLGSFLERGGRIVWGAVPVDQPLGTSEELLWRRLSALWCELVAEGLDPLTLRSRSLVGPADGLGHFGATQAQRVLELTDSLSTRIRRQAVGARLTLGA